MSSEKDDNGDREYRQVSLLEKSGIEERLNGAVATKTFEAKAGVSFSFFKLGEI